MPSSIDKMPDLSHHFVCISYLGGRSARWTGELKVDNEAQKSIESKHVCGESTGEAQTVVWIFTVARVSGYNAVNSPTRLLQRDIKTTNKVRREIPPLISPERLLSRWLACRRAD